MQDSQPTPNPHRDYCTGARQLGRRAVDDSTVKSDHVEDLLRQLALPYGRRAPRASCRANRPGTNATNPIGTGPFKFGSWNRGASLALTRNDGYWGSKAKLTDVEFRFISDGNAMNNALQAGDIDAIGQVGALQQVAQFQQDPAYTVIKGAVVGQGHGVGQRDQSGPLGE